MTKRRKKRKARASGELDPFSTLGISEKDWQISIRFTKGALSGGRGVVVEVVHAKTGLRRRASSRSTTKAHSRQVALTLVKELVDKPL